MKYISVRKCVDNNEYGERCPMADKQKSISVMVNRKECKIPLESIVYAQVSDKLCTIHLYGSAAPPFAFF